MAETQIFPFLMFEGNAEAAMNLYVSVFPNAKIEEISRYGPEGPGSEGTVVKAKFVIGSQSVMCIDSFVKHEFSLTPAFSFFVECESEGQQDSIFVALSAGGSVFMPMDNYGFSRRFTWFADKFGVSWQLNLA